MNKFFKLILNKVNGKKHSPGPIGKLPVRKSSVVALVLAKLLSGQKINAIGLMPEIQTSRLKDHIASLRQKHGWASMCSSRIAVATADGRVQWVSEYWLSEEVRGEAMTDQVMQWVREVVESRRIHCQDKWRAKRKANSCNRRKLRQSSSMTGGQK